MAVRVLVLAWDARSDDGGMPSQAAGLATALAAGGDHVQVVTRRGEHDPQPGLAGVELHAVADAPPIIPAELDEPLLAAEAFAARAMAVAVRRLREQPADVVHAVGWQAGPVVAGLRSTHDVRVAASLAAADLDRDRLGELPVATARQLASDADLVLAATEHDAEAIAAATTRRPLVVPPGVVLPARAPGPPPSKGPVHLVAPIGASHRAVATELRGALDRPRRITRSWRRRPLAVAVLDPAAVGPAVRALASGVPLLAADGPAGELATRTGGGLVVEPTGTAVAAAVDRLVAEPRLAAALGEVGAAAAVEHGWSRVARRWRAAVERQLPRPAHLHAAG